MEEGAAVDRLDGSLNAVRCSNLVTSVGPGLIIDNNAVHGLNATNAVGHNAVLTGSNNATNSGGLIILNATTTDGRILATCYVLYSSISINATSSIATPICLVNYFGSGGIAITSDCAVARTSGSTLHGNNVVFGTTTPTLWRRRLRYLLG